MLALDDLEDPDSQRVLEPFEASHRLIEEVRVAGPPSVAAAFDQLGRLVRGRSRASDEAREAIGRLLGEPTQSD